MSQIQPKLRTFDLTMIVAGLVIGMGIFRTPSEVASNAQLPYIFFLAWFAGGVASMIGGLTFAEIGSAYPVAGGFYKIFSYCYHPSFAFMVNWITVISNAASTAGVAIIGAEYLAPLLFPDLDHDIAIKIITITSVAALYFVNLSGIKTSSFVLNLLMVFKMMLLLIIISSVFILPFNSGNVPVVENNFSSANAFLLCFIPVFFTYGGYQQTMNFGGDAINASKSIPRAIIIGMLLVMLFYFLINYAYYYVLGLDGLASTKTLAADMVGRMFGPEAFYLISVFMFFSVMAYANVSIMSNPRVYFAMAEDKVLPATFKNVNPKTQVQFTALSFFCVLIVLTLFFMSSFTSILQYVMFFDSISLITAAACIFILRKRKVAMENPDVFRMKGYPYLPLLFIIIYFGVILSVFITNPWSILWGFLLFLSGFPLYFLIRNLISRSDARSN